MLSQLYVDVFWSLGKSHLSGYLHIMEMAFGSNVAYAVLIRSGELQGENLTAFAERRYQHAKVAHDLLAAERPELMQQITIDGNRDRCASFVSLCKKRIATLVPLFSLIAALMSIACILLVFICGVIPDAILSNVVAALGTIVLFSPIPVALLWTYSIVSGVEKKIVAEYARFFDLPSQFTTAPSKQIQDALENIEKEMREQNPGVFKRFFSSTHWT